LNFLGIDNVLVIRGDSRKAESQFIPTPGGHSYASDLLGHVSNMNKGIFLHEDIDVNMGTDFCIGVAGYPEKHFEAPNMKSDIKYLKHKVDLGAEFIVTQMFFDNQKYIDFVALCRENGINIPIIPGLKPITNSKQIITLPKVFHIDLPEDLSEAVNKCKNEQDVKQVGVEWLIQQSKELIKLGAPVLHYYTMGNANPTYQIAKAVF
jgi:methylenetetrahydrofolate reductase (NADPH)